MATLQEELKSITDGINSTVQTSPAASVLQADVSLFEAPTAQPVEVPGVATLETAKPLEPVVTQVPAQVEPSVIDNWDTIVADTEIKSVAPVEFDFTTIGKDLGLEVRTKDELVNQVRAIRTQADQLKQERDSLLSNVPQDLVKAIDLAKKGGDYLGYLGIGATDYATADPVEVYTKFVENSLTDPKTGVTDWDKVDSHLDKLDDADLEIRGRQIQLQYVQYQNEQRAQKEQQIYAQRQEQERDIRQAVDRLEKVGDFKVSSTHKQEIYQDLLADPLKDYRKGNGQFDFEKLARDRFILKNYEKLDKFRQQQIKNAAKREILNEITNPELTKPGALPAPIVKKGYTMDDLLNDVSRVK